MLQDNFTKKEEYIFYLIISGESYKKVGIKYGISGNRIRQIFKKTCRKLIRFYAKKPINYDWSYLKDIRKNRKNWLFLLLKAIYKKKPDHIG